MPHYTSPSSYPIISSYNPFFLSFISSSLKDLLRDAKIGQIKIIKDRDNLLRGSLCNYSLFVKKRALGKYSQKMVAFALKHKILKTAFKLATF